MSSGNIVLSVDAIALSEINRSSSIFGTNGSDRLVGTPGNDLILAFGGNDTLSGLAGNDTLNGQAGNDSLIGSAGNDDLLGGSGNDSLHGGEGNDDLIGEDGNDRIFGNLGNDDLDGGLGNDLLNGGEGNDDLIGGSASGNDTLNGGIGNDRLFGGDGRDTLIGGAGRDEFMFFRIFSTAPKGDTVRDFVPTEDEILLDRVRYNLRSVVGRGFSVASEFAIVNTDLAAANSAAKIVYNQVNGSLFYNANQNIAGLGGSGELIAIFEGAPRLSRGNFEIFLFSPEIFSSDG
jgi:Ca2+-binding RTX toxin-like protein